LTKFLLILLIWVGLFISGCSTLVYTPSHNAYVKVDETSSSQSTIDSIVQPYRDSMQLEMGQVIGRNSQNIVRSKPNGLLNNWCADALLLAFELKLADKKHFVLLNYGGLRSPLNQGEIRLEDVFKLMPFDNEVVLVKIRRETLLEIGEYLGARNGEPIAGAMLHGNSIEIINDDEQSEFVWIITSDYLSNGGDDMQFFEDKIEEVKTGVLLRDVFIEAVKIQGNLVVNTDNRIFEK